LLSEAGHIIPITALARRLQQRGHTAVIFGIADIEAPADVFRRSGED